MPRSAANMLDLSGLPATERREMRDFFQFLLSKCAKKQKPVSRRFVALIDNPLTVDSLEIPSRESLYDR